MRSFCLSVMKANLVDVRKPYFWRDAIAETVGVFFLVLIGCGSCMTIGPGLSPGPDDVQIALAFGFGVATLVSCTAHMSGGFLNPAITMGRPLCWFYTRR